MSLPALLRAKPRVFDVLARAWLDQGAAAFAVWDEAGAPVACWPEAFSVQALADTPRHSAPVLSNGLPDGEIRVYAAQGALREGAEQRLQADAALVAHFMPLARDLDLLASELMHTRDQLLAVYHLANSGRSCMETEQYLKNLVAHLPRMGRAEAAFAVLEVPNGPVLVRQYPQPVLADEELIAAAGQPTQGDHLLVNDPDHYFGNAPQLNNLLMMQVEVRGASRAAIGLINKYGGSFMMPDIKLLRSIASYAGAELENLLLFQENVRLARLETELALAQRVQSSLIPKVPPAVTGLEISASAVPASLVGGDFYDFIVRPNLPFTFAVGDISGKGFPAALLMSMTRTALRSEAVAGASPEGILRGMNRELYEDFTRLSSFATLFVGQYLPAASELRYANAGHSPVIHVPQGQPARMLTADGTALGILPETLSMDQRLDFLPGDLLMVGTDGLAEARGPGGKRFGYEQLLSLTESLAAQPVKAIAAQIFQCIADFRQTTQQDDDQTLVIIKCLQTSSNTLIPQAQARNA